MENARQFPLIEVLNDEVLRRIHAEAIVGYNEYKACLALTSQEIGRRALLLADSTGFYDAAADLGTLTNPPDAPQLWSSSQDWG